MMVSHFPVITTALSAGMNIAVSTAEPFSVTGNPPDALRIAPGSVGIPVLETALLQVREAIEYSKDL
ncbi:hypothetical protein HA49_05475 [Tatumella morbirosei]|uniref:Uncharacterized protein n=1 Tax=Tatumella morbirosei TaxID=642227 RepID=A0A095TDJ2_9GAMM|nr:hypothetical protein [Tatumella morbirosei]KGD74767.1 hypothetical protein HA49_05475 [Tatumella morbirosei]